jgi:sugar-specific transcriptional regulator TrmB
MGLSAYAARTFVALVGLGDATAQEVSDAADVPRTRVYDAAEELRDLGLVDVQRASPKRFWAVSPETAGRRFEREYTHRVNTLTEALDALEDSPSSEEQRGVWTVTDRESVRDRTLEFVETAADELVYMTVDDLLTDDLLDALRAAAERGVTVRLAGVSESVEGEVREAVPGVEPFETMWEWSDTPAGRLLMADGERTLVSVLVPEAGSEERDETAIWGRGETNSLVVVLRAMFTWQLDESRD